MSQRIVETSLVQPFFPAFGTTLDARIYLKRFLPMRYNCGDFFFWWTCSRDTETKTNMEAENHPLAKENHLPNLHFRVPMLIFQGVTIIWMIIPVSKCLVTPIYQAI